jgi:hypothetical protein
MFQNIDYMCMPILVRMYVVSLAWPVFNAGESSVKHVNIESVIDFQVNLDFTEFLA